MTRSCCGGRYPGQHEAILEQALQEQAQAIPAEDARQRASQTMMRHDNESILRGLLFAPNGNRMLPTATKKKSGKRYRHYLPYSDKKLGRGSDPFGIVPAGQIEVLVLEQVKAALQAPEMIQAVWDEVQKLDATVSEPTVVLAMRNLSVVWNEMFPAERCRLVGADGGIKLTTFIPVRFVRHKARKVVAEPTLAGRLATPSMPGQVPVADESLMRALAKGMFWQQLLDEGRVASINDLAAVEGGDRMRVYKMLKLARLAPEIVEDITRGRQPVGLSMEFFMGYRLPDDWDAQRQMIAGLSK